MKKTLAPQAGVNPRKKRYAKADKGIRQYHAVEEGLEAKEGCENVLLLCNNKGSGKVIRATLMEKLVMLSLTKFAALDAYGMGIDMEGGKPGWNDALNGFPGLSGSTAEFLQMWTLMMFVKQPFVMTENGLTIQFAPALPEYLIPEDGKVTAQFLGNMLVSYKFAEKKDYIPGEYSVNKIIVTWKDGSVAEFDNSICGKAAEAVRNGEAAEIVVIIK